MTSSVQKQLKNIFFVNPLFNVVKNIKLPIDLIFIILSYDSIIHFKQINIKYVNRLFLYLENSNFSGKYFPGWKNINSCHELAILIKTGKRSINWNVIKRNEEDCLISGIRPDENIFVNRRAISKVASCVLRYPLRKKMLILKKLGKESLCDNYISEYNSKSLFSKLKYELKDLFDVDSDTENDISKYMIWKWEKSNKLKQSKESYNIRKMSYRI